MGDSDSMSAPHTTTLSESAEINVNDAAEVLRWSEEFGVTELELRDAIRNVGPAVEDVKRCLADMQLEEQEDATYDSMPAEEGGKLWEREHSPMPRPE